MSFIYKVALVTGGSSGIGASTAIQFAKEGADVAIVGRNEAKLKNIAAKCEEFGKKPLVIVADVAKDEDAERLVKETVERFGKIDILVNNAGVVKFGSLLEGDITKAYDEVFNINVRGVINITKLATPYLIESKGNIVNISSAASVKTPVDSKYTPYYVSKAALDHFTRCAALELSSKGVRVNSVNPGPVKTDIFETMGYQDLDTFFENMAKRTALNRVGEPEEIADLILFLAGDKAKSITGSIFFSENGILLK